MEYNVSLRLPAPWISESDTYEDESGALITHLEASLPSRRPDSLDAFVDIYVGDMPEGETAEDQAFANYAETVGFSEDDPEDFNPIFKTKFNGRNAWGFDALCENDTPMRFLAQEVRAGVLAIIVFGALDDARTDELQHLLESGFRVR